MLAIILIDALDKSYFTKKNMPFLYDLAKKNLYSENYFPLAGFEHRHYILWSKYPDQVSRFTQFSLDKYSPYKKMKLFLPLLNFLDKIPKVKTLTRILLQYYFKKKYKMAFCNFGNIPYDFLVNFSSKGEDKPLETLSISPYISLFDLFRRNNLKYLYLWWPFQRNLNLDEDRVNEFIKETNLKKYDVSFLHLSLLDRVGHNTDGKNIKKYVKKIDNMIKKLFEKSPIKKFIIFGDHGMIPVKTPVDSNEFISTLKKEKAIRKETLYFIDSTMIRFWDKNKHTINKLKKSLKNFKFGYLIEKKLKEKYHLNFKNNKFGDVMFFLKEGYMFSPDFFSNKKVMGMHGYLPEEDPSILVCSSTKVKKIKSTNDLDIAPTILELLNLPNEKSFEGISVLRK